jgi:hypothetical protein
VVPRANLDIVEKRKFFCPYPESNPNPLAHSLSLYRQSYPGSTVSLKMNIIEKENRI